MARSCDNPPYTPVLTGTSARPISIQYCMEASMRDLLLEIAGTAAIVVALIHGVLGETKVFSRATIEPPRLRTLIRLVWQAGTGGRVCGRGLLIAGPSPGSCPAPRRVVL